MGLAAIISRGEMLPPALLWPILPLSIMVRSCLPLLSSFFSLSFLLLLPFICILQVVDEARKGAHAHNCVILPNRLKLGLQGVPGKAHIKGRSSYGSASKQGIHLKTPP